MNRAAYFRSEFLETYFGYKMITEEVNLSRESRNSAPINFHDSSRAVMYAANGEFSSNVCRTLMTRTQMVLKLTNKPQMAEVETDSRIDVYK